jgi:sugar phosphate isomerase/epimerase
MTTRRDFLKTSAAVCGTALLNKQAFALGKKDTLHLPVGIQLYSVRTLLPKDYLGTLKQVVAAGYTEAEAAGFYNLSAADAKTAMDQAGLKCVSSHWSFQQVSQQTDMVLEYAHTLGMDHVICPGPGRKPGVTRTGHEVTLEDWRWNAEQFNVIGKKFKDAGVQFGYHNHYVEFQVIDGVTPLFELLKLTDPKYVSFELDCGWVRVGGADPAEILTKYPKRFSMLHIKDFKDASPAALKNGGAQAAENGLGTVDYKPIFKAAAKTGNIKHIFVEQEQFLDMPAMQALKTDADYIKSLEA